MQLSFAKSLDTSAVRGHLEDVAGSQLGWQCVFTTESSKYNAARVVMKVPVDLQPYICDFQAFSFLKAVWTAQQGKGRSSNSE